ncbi:response regulator [Azospirillum sp. RWY-5-1]|uniref:Response regulator n=1 Tax=Azospirillum oleiclasticum TaxID=2735135 RepID=A0ABX2TIQ0_9PROT|nr:response regulator [Azospirillum oleiclasticum]NYZ16521.1 response regulator [Azospirillum oleiclasticum]NYZ24009.1 response regulator [Azospirillum oleiclasticum]
MVALLIEEDSLVRAAMCLVLTSWGVRILDVPSLLVAERAVAGAGVVPGIVLTALNVGGAADNNDAFELLPPILERIGFTGPVIVTTGDTSPERSGRIAALGWTRLVKPFRPDELRAVLAECLPAPGGG